MQIEWTTFKILLAAGHNGQIYVIATIIPVKLWFDILPSGCVRDTLF